MLRMKTFLSTALIMLIILSANAEEKFLHWKDITANPVITGVSSNGKYAVGYNGLTESSFIWDIDNDTKTWLTSFEPGSTDYSKSGVFTDISDNKTIAGQYRDTRYTITVDGTSTPIKVAAVWDENGNVTNLGIGDDLTVEDIKVTSHGTVANAISADGTVVVGEYNGQGKFGACCWRKQADGSWKYEPLPLPEYPADDDGNIIPIEDASAVDVSADGSVIVGWFQMQHTSYPCYWKDGQIFRMQYDMGDWTSLMNEKQNLATSVSPNGRFMGFYFNGKRIPGIYDIENKTYVKMEVPDDGAKTTENIIADNNGDLFYTLMYGSVFTGNYSRPMWYSAKSGSSVDLNYFLSIYAPNVKPSADSLNFAFEAKQQLSTTAVSADGTLVAGTLIHSGMPRAMESWIFRIDENQTDIPDVPESPTGELIGDRTVKLKWKKSVGTSKGFTIMSYNVYSNGRLIATVKAEDNKDEYEYIASDEDAGYIRYSLACNYRSESTDSLESPHSHSCEVCVPENFSFPFFEDYENENWTDNYWELHDDDGVVWGMRKHCGFGNSMVGASVSMSGVDPSKPYCATVLSRPIDATGISDNIHFSFAIYPIVPAENVDGDFTKDSISIDVAEAFTDEWHNVKSISLKDMDYSYKFFDADLTEYAAGKLFRIRMRVHGQNSLNSKFVFDKVSVDVEKGEAPEGLTGHTINGYGRIISWKNSIGAYELNYLPNIYGNVYTKTAGNAGKDFIGANLFTPDYLSQFNGKYLTAVKTRINNYESEENTKTTKVSVMIYSNDKLILEEPVENFTTFNRDTLLILGNPIQIDGSKSMKVALKVYDYDEHQIPLVYVCSNQYRDGYSNIYSEDGGKTWLTLSDAYADAEKPEDGWGAWYISGQVTDGPNIDADVEINDSLVAYNIYSNGKQINEKLISAQEARFVDSESSLNIDYQVKAFYNNGGVSPISDIYSYDSTDLPIVKDEIGNSFSIWPNPTDDVINIRGEFDSASLFTVGGCKVMNIISSTTDISGLSHGIYLLELRKDGRAELHKIIKR